MREAIPLLHDYLEAAAARCPDTVALVCADQRFTYRQLDDEATALSATLAAAGVARGERVIVFGDNSRQSVVAFWATLKAGAVVSIVSALTKAQKLAYLVQDCTPAALVTDAHLFHEWRAAALEPCVKTVIVSGALTSEQRAASRNTVAWDEAVRAGHALPVPSPATIDVDLAAIIYTSGSSGEPKGVMLTHRNMLTAAASISSYLELREDDVILNMLPMAFDYGLYQMILAFRQGARLVLERSFAYPARTLSLIAAERVTVFPGVPTVFALLSALKEIDRYDFSSIRSVTNTAAALAVKQIESLAKLFPNAAIYSMYGLTECKRCTYLPPEDVARKPTSVGIAIPNTELWIVDDDDRRVGPNVVGQLVIRGATVMKGYWGKPEATARKLKPGPLPGEQVLYTGDYCKLDEEGYLYFIGRMDDIIKCRGEKVAPREVEAAIVEIAGVRDAAVIGVADEVLGQAVKAFVVLEADAKVDENDVRRACQRRLESFMVPKEVVFLPALPTTHTGKVTKAGLA